MPELHWVGKAKVVNHHHDVPYRLLERQYRYQAPAGTPRNSTANRIVHGDNLEALKSLLPEFEGKVDVIYIDPPYNTGNEGWVYNDNVNDPRIKKWLGEVVGKEGEDLSRHDKWLCMMYPRLALLKRLLKFDGVLLASIDDIEFANLQALLDDIFGRGNRIGNVVWHNANDNNPTNIAAEHEYVLCYAKSKARIPAVWKAPNSDAKDRLVLLAKSLIDEHENSEALQAAYSAWLRENKPYIWPFQDYKYIDKGGIYTGSRSVHNPGKDGYRYDVIHPRTGLPCKQPLMGYRFPADTMSQLLLDERILFGPDEQKIVELKIYAQDYKSKLASVFELDGRAGTNEIKSLFPESKRIFNFPKPSALLEELLSFTTAKEAVVLDSFAGSGTTAHAVLKLNAADGGNRRFILTEMMDYAETITAERVRRVMAGYGESGKAVAGLGGGFEYSTVGPRLFDDEGHLNEAVGAEAIRRHVAFTENIPAQAQVAMDNPVSPYLLGRAHATDFYFYYEPERITELNRDFLRSLPKPDGATVIYADVCTLDEALLRRYQITFKKIPRDIAKV